MNESIKWHYVSEEGLPKLKGDKAKGFLICYRVELGEPVFINGVKADVIPTGKFINSCTVALIQKKESVEGFAHTPAMKFYWGPTIFDTVYAWAEMPKAIEFK